MRVCRYGAARTLISSVHLLKLPADTGDAITKQRALGKQYKALARPFNPQSGRSGFIADRKSTRLNSSHQIISYAVFCLKKKKKNIMLLKNYKKKKNKKIIKIKNKKQ